MYICLCERVTDRDLKRWKETHPTESFIECCEKLNIGGGCGICKLEALSVFLESSFVGSEEFVV